MSRKSIEPIDEADFETLCVIAQTTLTGSVILPNDALQNLIAHTRKNIALFIARADCVFLKYEERSTTIGYILIKEYWNLSDLFVLPEHQRKGVGSALLVEALSICRLHSTKQFIRLNSSLNAVEFYKRHGFNEAGKTQAKFEHSAPMQLNL